MSDMSGSIDLDDISTSGGETDQEKAPSPDKEVVKERRPSPAKEVEPVQVWWNVKNCFCLWQKVWKSVCRLL